MNNRQRNRLVNLNRSLIFGLTSGGLLLDGLQISDLPCTAALLMWLWLPVCTRLELNLVSWASGRTRHPGAVVPHPHHRPTT